MLPKNRRIERKLFSDILKGSKKQVSQSFIFYVLNMANNKDFLTKFSFSVSKKVAKKSVQRNKLRRRGYSIISKNLSDVKNGYLCLFVYKKEYQKDFELLEKEILGLLSNSLVIR